MAVVSLFLAMRAVAYRSFSVRAHRRAALTLGVLFGSFTVIFGALGILGDMMPTWLSWGYPFGLMAVALITFAIVRYERMRVAGRPDWICGLLGGLASALHPWQGETLILLNSCAPSPSSSWRDGLLWWRTRQWRRLALPALTLALTALPLLYYLLLGHLDLSWELARVQSKHAFPFSAIAIGIAPLAIPALLGYRGRSDSFLELLLRVWAPVAVAIYIFSATGLSATPLHAFDGILRSRWRCWRSRASRAPRCWPRCPWRGAGMVSAAVIALGVIPANAYALATAHKYVDPASGNANFITHDERRGAALSGQESGQGRRAHPVLPRRGGARGHRAADVRGQLPVVRAQLHAAGSEAADALFRGQDTRAQARQLVRQSGARFLLAELPVAPRRALSGRSLGEPHRVATRQFGCATVYELGPPADTTGPLAELPPNAAVRAPRRQ